MEIRQVKAFLAVATSKSFSKAADELGYSQSAITIQIKQLEKDLGTRLFDRIGKNTSLTYPGQQFYIHANRIIKEVNDVQNVLKAGEELDGNLRIGTIESLCFSDFPYILREFQVRHPKVNISITMDEPEALLDKLSCNEVDIVYFLNQRLYGNTWIKSLEKTEEIVFVSSSKHPKASQKNIPLSNILNETFFLTEKNANYRYALDQFLSSQNQYITPFLEISNTEFILNLVKENLGISFLPKFAILKEYAKGSLAILDIKDFHMKMWKQVVHHKDKWVTREMLEFIELVKS